MHGGVPVPEAADALGISERTVRRRIKAGTLDAYEITTIHGPAWRVVLPSGDGGHQSPEVSSVVPTVAKPLDRDRLRVVVEELQRTRERVAALEALLPEYGPRDPGPPVDLPREIIEDGATIVPVMGDDAVQGIWARFKAWLGGRG